jgi:hypothetical protein
MEAVKAIVRLVDKHDLTVVFKDWVSWISHQGPAWKMAGLFFALFFAIWCFFHIIRGL